MRSSQMVVFSLFIAILLFVTKENILEKNEYIARVISIDNNELIQRGVSRIGGQRIEVEILSKERKGKTLKLINRLNGSAEYDEYYEVGNKILINIIESNGKIIGSPVSLYRIPTLLNLLFIFAISLIIYAKKIGIKSLFSFLASIIMIYYYLIPRILKGDSAMVVSLIFISVLTGIIVFSVAGFSKKGIVAFLGTVAGLVTAFIMTQIFLDGLALTGLTMPMSQALITSGNFQINLIDILYSGIIISASGAAMDIAMDMAVSMEEILYNSPDISRKDLIKSGFNIGSAVIGTMSTTLLLAYTGGNITMMMLMVDRGLSISNILNSKLISVEVAKTLIGTTSLLIVAPVTAFIAAFIYMEGENKIKNEKFKFKVKNNLA